MKSNAKILIIEDSESMGMLCSEYLEKAGHSANHVLSKEDGLAELAINTFDMVLIDLGLPDGSGMDILKEINGHPNSPSAIIITAEGSIKAAVEAMKEGARDFLMKPFTEQRLITSVENALENRDLRQTVEKISRSLNKKQFQGFIGQSLPMQAVYKTIENVAASNASIFISGESGTGKEVCAQAIHEQSERNGYPFVAINCGAIPKELLESEIFGHKKGAFTGALKDRDGAAVSANGGTLFLDEICELDLDLQIKLLRFIQTKTFRKVGGDKDIMVDIRFVCATNKDPLTQVQKGEFREDLFYRLNVIPISMPPLRGRGNDIIELAEHFLKVFSKQENKEFKSFDELASKHLLSYPWPGNVRELQNVIQQIAVLESGETVTLDMIPDALNNNADNFQSETPAATYFIKNSTSADNAAETQGTSNGEFKPLWIIEKEAMERTIDQCDGNVVRAAAYLEVSPSTVYRKMKGWGVEL